MEILKIGRSMLPILARNYLALTFLVEGRLATYFLKRKGWLNISEQKHVAVVFDEAKYTKEAWRLFKFLHGQETKQHLIWKNLSHNVFFRFAFELLLLCS